MRKNFFTYLHTDLVGFSSSMACAVHCSLLPIVLTFSTFSSLQWLSDPWIEVFFICTSVLIAFVALGRNFRKHKHIQRAVQVVAAGFALIILSRLIHGEAHHYLSAAGGIVIAGGHILNWQGARKSACCKVH